MARCKRRRKNPPSTNLDPIAQVQWRATDWQKPDSSKEYLVADGHELGMWLRKAYLSFHRRANARMLKHGVTADQFVVLSLLAREEGITQVTIVERTASDPNTVAAILGLLERRGLVRREQHAQDRRARCVFLTAEGRRVQRRTAKEAEPLLGALWDSMNGASAADIERFLKRAHAVFTSAATGNGAAKRPATKAKQSAR
jgi:MarR family transcriptional regulator, organic hydroperoxide resistance regulator